MYWYNVPSGRNNYGVGCLRAEIFLHKLGHVGFDFPIMWSLCSLYCVSLNRLFILGVMYPRFFWSYIFCKTGLGYIRNIPSHLYKHCFTLEVWRDIMWNYIVSSHPSNSYGHNPNILLKKIFTGSEPCLARLKELYYLKQPAATFVYTLYFLFLW
jgi:hypothetical protein